MVGLKHVGVVIALWAYNVLGEISEQERRGQSFVKLGQQAAKIEYPIDHFDYGKDVGDCVCRERFKHRPLGYKELLGDWLEECVADIIPKELPSAGGPPSGREPDGTTFRSSTEADLAQRGLVYSECICDRKIQKTKWRQKITADDLIVFDRHCREKIAEWSLLANIIQAWSEESLPTREPIRREIPIRVPKPPWKRTQRKNPPGTFTSSRREGGTPPGSRQGARLWQRLWGYVSDYFHSAPDERQQVPSGSGRFGGARPAIRPGF